MRYSSLAWAIPVLILAAVVALVVSKPASPDRNPASGSSADSTAGGTLIWARSTDTTTLDPQEIEWGEDAKVSENIYETLVTFSRDSVDIVPGLAAKWDTSPDGRTWTFHLRNNVTFHDGTQLNAEAAAFTFRRLTDPKFESRPTVVPYEDNYKNIVRVEAAAPDRVVFTLKDPSSVFLQTLALFSAGIVSPAAVRKEGKNFKMRPAGCGPYRLAEWKLGEKLVLERFGRYHGPAPSVHKAIFLPVQSPQTALQRLKNGEVHAVDHATLADIHPLQSDPAATVVREKSMNVAYLGFNMKKAPYNDIHFRRAVSMALDRRTLNTLVYYGLGEISRNIVPPVIWGKTGDLDEYEHNVARAKEELAQAKLPAGFQAELWHMTFARPYMQEPHRVAEFVKDQLRAIGLDVKIASFEKSAFTNKVRDPEHPMYLLGWNADYADPDNFFYPLLHGDSAGDLNGSFFNHPEFNETVKKAQSELDAPRRAALYRRAAEIYRAELPTLPLIHVSQLVVVSKKVEYKHHPLEYRISHARFR